jgi:pre-mRNA-splicing factor 38B
LTDDVISLSLSLICSFFLCTRKQQQRQEYFLNALVPTEDIDDLIDEIYNEVSDVEPWMSGNARGASTAFCILYRILAMENVPHFKINKMIYHRDSVYIRCIGLLYARYKFYNDEENLMKFFGEDVFGDTMDASFSPSVDKKKLTSFSQFAIDLICSQEYFETLFPRIPEVLKRKIQAKIETWLNVPKAEAKGGGGIGEWRRSKGDGKGRVMSVKESLSVNVGQRAPHLANARERGRSGFDPESNRSFNRDRDRDRGRGGGGGGKFRGRDGSRDRRNDDNRYHHHRNRGGGGDRRDSYRRSYDDYDDYDDDRDRRRRDDSRERRRRGGDREERELPYARELPYKR